MLSHVFARLQPVSFFFFFFCPVFPGDTLGGHGGRHGGEDPCVPLVSLSLGCKAMFLLGGPSRAEPPWPCSCAAGMSCSWPAARAPASTASRPMYCPCTVLYCTVLYCDVLYSSVLLCCSVLYCAVLYSTVQPGCTIPHSKVHQGCTHGVPFSFSGQLPSAVCCYALQVCPGSCCSRDIGSQPGLLSPQEDRHRVKGLAPDDFSGQAL